MKAKSRIGVFIVAAIFFSAGVAGATFLLLGEAIGEASFVALVLISLGVGCLIGFYGSIEVIKLSEFEIRFREVKESEEKIKRLGLSIVALVEQLEKSAFVDHSFDQAAFDKAKDEVKKNAEA